MKLWLLYILFIAFSPVAEPVEAPVSFAKSQSIAEISCQDSALLCDSASFINFSGSQIQYYESQIHIADSLYKNYLPQYNFDEVKKAVEFFESIRNEELGIRNYEREETIPNSTFHITSVPFKLIE